MGLRSLLTIKCILFIPIHMTKLSEPFMFCPITGFPSPEFFLGPSKHLIFTPSRPMEGNILDWSAHYLPCRRFFSHPLEYFMDGRHRIISAET